MTAPDLPLAIGTVALFAVLTLLTPRRNWQPLALLAAPITLTVAAVLLFNGVIFGTWSLSPASQSFFLANLIAYGPAREYLHEACPQAGYKMCAYTDRLPNKADTLLWEDGGIFNQLGNFPAWRTRPARSSNRQSQPDRLKSRP
jgi:hypothetical protein